VTGTSDLFGQINNAVLDLQNSQFQSYERPLRTLARLLRHPDLEAANAELTKDVDLEAFLAGQAHRGGMVGSDRLEWPDDPEQTLGVSLLLIEKFAANPDEMYQFGHRFYYSGNKLLGDIRSVVSQLIIPFIRDYKAYVTNRGSVRPQLIGAMSNKIFVVHGHDDYARETVARFLEKIGFQAIILHERPNQGRTIIEKVEAESDVGFAVVLLTPDDQGCANGGALEPRARQNVILELGYFLGRLGRPRVCALKRGVVDIPSDFTGVVWTEMDAANGWRTALARELAAAGYNIDWNKVMK
jgi:hypothetical protein